MEGRFTEDGSLELKRANGWVIMECPFTCRDAPCGTWCPHVTEPIRQENKKFERPETVVYVCHGKHWKFSDFEDKRTPI
jgi:hypothetical protein